MRVVIATLVALIMVTTVWASETPLLDSLEKQTIAFLNKCDEYIIAIAPEGQAAGADLEEIFSNLGQARGVTLYMYSVARYGCLEGTFTESAMLAVLKQEAVFEAMDALYETLEALDEIFSLAIISGGLPAWAEYTPLFKFDGIRLY